MTTIFSLSGIPQEATQLPEPTDQAQPKPAKKGGMLGMFILITILLVANSNQNTRANKRK